MPGNPTLAGSKIGGKTKSNSLLNQKPDEDNCKSFNADLMKSLIARKMYKQKTFYEVKCLN